MCKYCGEVKQIYDDDFSDYIAHDCVLVAFVHSRCKAARPLMRFLRKMEHEYPELLMLHYNMATDVTYAIRYEVYATPTLLLFRRGVLSDRVSGFTSEEDMMNLLDTWQNRTKD